MKTFYKIYQGILKDYGRKDLSPKIDSIAMGRNIKYFIEFYRKVNSLEEKELILNIIYGIRLRGRRISHGQKEILSKFMIEELNEHIHYINKFEIMARFELKDLGSYLLHILEKQWDTLPVDELDTLIYALGAVGYKPAQKYIMKFLDSEHRTVRECAKQALKRLKKSKQISS